MAESASTCPSCGKPSGGKFCRHCGAGLGGAQCPRCGSALGAGARFCAQCGTSAGAAAGGLSGNERLAWFLAGGVVVALVGGLVLTLGKGSTPPVAEAASVAPFAGGATGPAPDISNMTPRERFDALFNRVMRAAESGDQGTVTTFSPMALQAYAMLDTVDADARYHLALIQLHTGDMDGARAQADSILKQQPGHLFGYVVKGTIARFQKNQKALDQAYGDFLAHYDKEKAAGRPEYAEHPRSLEDFVQAARAARGGS